MKKNMFLQVAGILMIIGGGITIILGILAVLGASALAVALGAGAGGLVFAAFLALASGALELVAGIAGVMNAAKPEKAQSCIVLGIIVIVLALAGIITTAVLGAGFSAVSLISSFALPVLYLIGAFQSKKSAQ